MIWINQIAETWLNLFTVHMLEISVFIALIWLIDKFMKLQPKIRYALWSLALMKVFIPPILTVPEIATKAISTTPFFYNVDSISFFTAEQVTTTGLLPTWIFLLWISSSVLLFCYILLKNARLRIRFSPTGCEIQLPQNELDSYPFKIFESEEVQTPVLLGILKPCLHLPTFWRTWTEEQLKAVIEHEKSHFRNRDILMLCLEYLSLILFCVNPLVWLVHYQLHYLRELRCDEMAISKTGVNPIEYSKFILSLIEGRKIYAGHFIVGKYFSDINRHLYGRIHYLLNHKERVMLNNLKSRILIILIAVLILPMSWRCESTKTDTNEAENPIALAEKQALPATDAKFVEYDVPPQPIGGYIAIQKNLKYPEIARKAGIEAVVMVSVQIDERGNSVKTQVMNEIEQKVGFEEAAQAALMETKWNPAQKDGKAVAVYVTVPIKFKLSAEK